MIILSDNLRKQLNAYQIKFIEMAFARLNELEGINANILTPELRLLYIKELYGIFSELNKIKFIRTYPNGNPNEETLIILQNLKSTVSFVRNVLLHFPLFKTWNDIWISKDFAKFMNDEPTHKKFTNSKNYGTIYHYLTTAQNKESLSFKLDMKDKSTTIFTINYPNVTSDEEKIYLKDILTEEDGVIAILNVMNHIF